MSAKFEPNREVYFISDGTGITVEALGKSLLTQFSTVNFNIHKISFVNSVFKAQELMTKITTETKKKNYNPIILSTLIDKKIRAVFDNEQVFFIDFFSQYLNPLEIELNTHSNHAIGKSHSVFDQEKYENRIKAINYTLYTDDGLGTNKYDNAELILIGVSRCGKTPTCIYLAIHYGIKAANYPLTIDDMNEYQLCNFLNKYKSKLFGLTIDPLRLQYIRQQRRSNSKYASLLQCTKEIKWVEKIMRQENIPFINTTHHSIEEISACIINKNNLEY